MVLSVEQADRGRVPMDTVEGFRSTKSDLCTLKGSEERGCNNVKYL